MNKNLLLLASLTALLAACNSPSAPGGGAGGPADTSSTQKSQTERLLGNWKFVYTIISTYSDGYYLNKLNYDSSDGTYYVSGKNDYGSLVVAGYYTSSGRFSLLDPSTSYDQFYTFNFVSGNSTVQGCYYLINNSTNQWSKCYTMNGTRTGTASVLSTGQRASRTELVANAEFSRAAVPLEVVQAYEAARRLASPR